MFNKLLSDLPFNPSLINQVSFYSKRLKQEASVRRLGFILLLLVMALQLFTVFSPSQPSLAISNNDLIPGGVSSKQQLVLICLGNAEYRAILAHFAITCNNLQNNSDVVSLRSTQIKDGQELYSMGRLPQGVTNDRTGKLTNEKAVAIDDHTYYMRRLASWDSSNASTYTALSVGNGFFVQFFILFSCGNLVSWGPPPAPAPKPTPPPPPPTPTPQPQPVPKPCAASQNNNDVESCLVKVKRAANTTQQIDDANHTVARAGDVIVYYLTTKNTANVTAQNYIVQEDLNDVLEYANLVDAGGAKVESGILTWPSVDIAADSNITKQIEVRVKDPIPKTPEPCNPDVVSPCPLTGSFDMLMTNVYGNEININVRRPVAKTVEITTTKTLVNTGPGTNLIVGFSITAVVGYFFARSRMMATELDLVKHDYTSGGY